MTHPSFSHICVKGMMAVALAASVAVMATAAHADNLAELVARQIEAKDAEARAKAAPTQGGQAQPAPTPIAAMPAGTPQGMPPESSGTFLSGGGDIRADDIQLIGVYGIGPALKALVCVRAVACNRDSAVTLTKGQRIKDWELAALTPDHVSFERPRKGSGKKAPPERREVYLSAAIAPLASSNSSGSPSQAGAFRTATPSTAPMPLIMPQGAPR